MLLPFSNLEGDFMQSFDADVFSHPMFEMGGAQLRDQEQIKKSNRTTAIMKGFFLASQVVTMGGLLTLAKIGANAHTGKVVAGLVAMNVVAYAGLGTLFVHRRKEQNAIDAEKRMPERRKVMERLHLKVRTIRPLDLA